MSKERTKFEIDNAIKAVAGAKKYMKHSSDCGDGWGCCCNVSFALKDVNEFLDWLNYQKQNWLRKYL